MISRHKRVTAVSIHDVGRSADKVAQYLAMLPQLTEVALHGAHAVQLALPLQALVDIPGLTSLELSECVVDRATAKAVPRELGRLTQLRALHLHIADGAETRGAALVLRAALLQLRALSRIHLSSPESDAISGSVTLTHGAHQQELRNQARLDLSPIALCQDLASMSSLRDVSLLRAPHPMSVLRNTNNTASHRYGHTQAVAGPLTALTALTRLAISAHHLAGERAQPLAANLGAHGLVRLECCECSMAGECLAAMAQNVSHLASLTALMLDRNPCFERVGMGCLFTALAKLPLLAELSISHTCGRGHQSGVGNDLTPAVAEEVAARLPLLTALSSLALYGVGLYGGIAALAPALARCGLA